MSEGTIAADALRLFIERIEGLEEEKKGAADAIRDVYLEAKASGYDVKTMRAIIRLRKMEPHDRAEAEALLETYKNALGMDGGTPDMFEGHDGRRAVAGFAEHLADMDAKGIGVAMAAGGGPPVPLNDAAGEDGLYPRALELVIEHQKASTSWLQRQLRIGYNSVARLIERMEAAGVVSPADARGRREVLTEDVGHALVAAVNRIVEPVLSGEAVH